MQARNFTKAFKVETRQHELLGLDLGEGPTREMLIFGSLFLIAWMGLLWLIFGPPTPHTFIFYLTIPAIVVYYAFQDSKRVPRRKNLAEWAIKAHYQTHGHRPIIGLDTRRATRAECRPLRTRLGLATIEAIMKPWQPPVRPWERQTTASEANPAAKQPVIRLNRHARLYGFEYVNDRVRKINAKEAKPITRTRKRS